MKTLQSFKKAKLVRYVIYDIIITGIIAGAFVFLSFHYSGKLVNFESEYLNDFFKYFSGTFALVITWFMLPTIVPLIAGFFEEFVIKRVENTYYGELENTKARFWPDFIHDIKFTFVSLFLNILVIPWYYFGVGFFMSIILIPIY
jgi:uncharacterized protein involved in cysteine biosynthesis